MNGQGFPLPDDLKTMRWFQGSRKVEDGAGRLVGLFDGDWSLNYMQEQHPKVRFLEEPARAEALVRA